MPANRAAAEVEPVTDGERLSAAVGLIARGDVAEADAIARGVLARDPSNAEALNLLGAAAIARQDGPGAVRVLAAAASAFPDRAEIVSNLAVAYQMTGAQDAALAAAEHACALEPGDARKRLMLGQLSLEGGRLRDASRHAEALLAAAPDDADALVFAATVALSEGDTGSAERLLVRAAARAPDHLDAQLNLSSLLAARGRRRPALAAAERARLAAPTDVRARIGFAARLAEAGRLDEAEVEIKQVLAVAPERVEPNELWSRIALARGSVEKAIASLAELVRRRGGDHEAMVALARILRAAGRFEQALTVVGDLAGRPDAPLGLLRLRQSLLLSTGRFAEAWPSSTVEAATIDGIVVENGCDIAEALIQLRFADALADRLGRTVPLYGEDVRALTGDPSRLAPAEGPPGPDTTLLALPAVPELFDDRLVAPLPGEPPRCDPERAAAWATALAAYPKPWIGVTWGDGVDAPSLEAIVSALDLPGTLVGLTGGEDRHQLATHPSVVDGGRHLRDLADVVAAVSLLDGFGGVEGAVLAVAGALGKPGVALLAAGHGWPWRAGPDGRSVWFPTIAVSRQPRPGSWHDAIAGLSALAATIDLVGAS
jgi:Flp pilus assembly protein TadD